MLRDERKVLGIDARERLGIVPVMKIFLTLLTLSMACNAQSLKWELSLPLPSPSVTNAYTIVPDGTGGAGIVVFGSNVARVVWASSRGAVNATHDFETQPSAVVTNAQAHYATFRQNTGQYSDEQIATDAVIEAFFASQSAAGCNILRVTAKVLDVQTTAKIVRFVKGKAPKELPLSDSETLATLPLPVPDKRGFFTAQPGSTNLTIRRYTL